MTWRARIRLVVALGTAATLVAALVSSAWAALPPRYHYARQLSTANTAADARSRAPDVVEWQVLAVTETLVVDKGSKQPPAAQPSRPGAREMAAPARRDLATYDIQVVGRVLRVERASNRAVRKGAKLTLTYQRVVDNRPGPGHASDPAPAKGAKGWAYLSCTKQRCVKPIEWGAFLSPAEFAAHQAQARSDAERFGPTKPTPAVRGPQGHNAAVPPAQPVSPTKAP